MFNQRIRQVMQSEKLLTAAPETTVLRAAQLMAEGDSGAVLVVEGGALRGIFTERDAVLRVMAHDLNIQTTCLADVMTAAPLTIGPERKFGHALELMRQHRIRHLPVVENGAPVGIVTGRSALDPDLEEFVSEALRREGFADDGSAATAGRP